MVPPLDHARLKAVAGALVAATQQPRRRPSRADVTARVRPVLGPPSSRRTVGRMLETDAIKPWRAQSGMCPRAPHCVDTAGPMLDRDAGRWPGEPLGPKDPILSADEQTSRPARRRCHPALPPAPHRAASTANASERGGALQYLAAWDGRRGAGRGRCEPTTGIAPLGRLVKQVWAEEPSRSGDRRLGIVANGSSQRGAASKQRLRQVDARLMLVQTPVHASGLQQVAIDCSIVQRKVLPPKDCADLEALRLRLALEEELSHHHPTPFQWKFDRATLAAWFAQIEARHRALADARLPCLKEAA